MFNITGLFRRVGFPVLGLGLGSCVLPQVLPGHATAGVARTPTDQGYRDLWVSDPAAAIVRLTLALREDPASPERWADLADAYLEAGRDDMARQCIQKASFAAPGLPHIRMRTANLSFRLGDTNLGLREMAAAVAASPEYALPAFQAWFRLGGGAEAVFRETGLGPDLARDYFVWLASNGSRSETDAVWRLLNVRKIVTERETRAYVDYLVQERDYPAAALIAATIREPGGNLLTDAGFEGTEGGSGWKIDPMQGVSAERDSSIFRTGGRSLRLQFSGTNPEYRNVTQRLILPQGLYRVSAFLRSRGVTSEQGVSIRIGDVNDEHHFAASPAVLGDQPWSESGAVLHVGPEAKLVEVSVSRRSSWGFDTPLSGTVWVDDVRLTRVRN